MPQDQSKLERVYGVYRILIALLLLFASVGVLLARDNGKVVTDGTAVYSFSTPHAAIAVIMSVVWSFTLSFVFILLELFDGRRYQALASHFGFNPVELVAQILMTGAILGSSITLQVKQQNAGCMGDQNILLTDYAICVGAPRVSAYGITAGAVCAGLLLVHIGVVIGVLKGRSTRARPVEEIAM